MTNTILHKSGEFLKSALARLNSSSTNQDYFFNLDSNKLSELTDSEKKIFWINVYNGLMQFELAKMNTKNVDKAIFTKPIFEIAGQKLSLDAIEHGLLRKNKSKYSLGYFRGRYLNEQTKLWTVDELDSRIHFQLNCGAESCPIIRVLNHENVDFELTEGEKEFVLFDTKVDHDKKTLTVSSLFLFYRKDFGGLREINKMMNQYFPFPNYKLKYKKWNWNIHQRKTK